MTYSRKTVRYLALVLSSILAVSGFCLPEQALSQSKSTKHAMPEGAQLGTDSDVTFLAQLAMIEGHLLAGTVLYRMGEKEMAMLHVEHPVAEIYGTLEPALINKNSKGFKAEITELVEAMRHDLPKQKTEPLLQPIKSKIAALRALHSAPADIAASVAVIMQLSALEYQEGVLDGQVTEAYEYQDAWGFAQLAKQTMSELDHGAQATHTAEISRIESELSKLDVLWPDLTGRKPISASPQILQDAVAVIGIAAKAIK